MIKIIWSRWNELIGKALLESAKETAKDKGFDIEVVSVPGAYEIPFALQEAFEDTRVNAAVLLGCLIEGETAHFDCLAKPTFKTIQDLSLKYRKPVGNGILTVQNLNQALERSGGKLGNKGREATEVVIELLEKFSRNENLSKKNIQSDLIQ